MSAALWGLATALGWGSADFIARFTGRAMGHETALLGMLAVGAVILPLVLWQAGLPLHWDPAGAPYLLLTGVGVMVATLLLYWGLARGPVTIVAPIVGSYPALNLMLAVVLGARPTFLEWTAMATVMAGVVTVAASARSFEASSGYSAKQLRGTVFIALASSFGFALTIAAAQTAEQYFGDLQTVCMARWISLLAIVLVFAFRRRRPRVPVRWWPLVAIQGILDGGAYVALLLGSQGPASAIAVVVASSFGAVTVVLARLILREAMTWLQWGGIVLVVAGVATLSAQGG
ncbi:MAG: DMT family transporter [Gammaproteobacteria bacterium]|nr:DMT family transporter [Gammaproteobacteria bacterium]